ncbi:MAG: hypothetical protein HY516_02635 [Candidatus Aenigmarchaeota archaeon]|nr:hypothetical protein [Candidatus Aenigmarchaeota archaeon]
MKNILLAQIMAVVSLLSVTVAALPGAISLDYQLLNDELIPGQETTIFLTFRTTTASPVHDITYFVSPGPYLSSDTKLVNLGSLGGSSSQQTSFKIKVADSAMTTISYMNVRVTYKDDQGDKETNLNIPVSIRRAPLLQIGSVSYSIDSVEPGSIVNLAITLNNNGDGLSREAQIILNQSSQVFSIVGASGQIFIGDLGSGSKKSVNYTIAINPNAGIGVYSIPILVSYKDETKTKTYTSSETIGMIISGKNKMMLIKNSQDVINPGSSGDLNLEIVNLGNQGIRFLTLKFSSQDSILVEPSQVYVGKLDSDDSDTTRIKVGVSKTIEPGDYQINAEIYYSDMFSNYYPEQKNFTLSVSEKDNGLKIGTTQIILFVAVVAAVYTFSKRLRKGRK